MTGNKGNKKIIVAGHISLDITAGISKQQGKKAI